MSTNSQIESEQKNINQSSNNYNWGSILMVIWENKYDLFLNIHNSNIIQDLNTNSSRASQNSMKIQKSN